MRFSPQLSVLAFLLVFLNGATVMATESFHHWKKLLASGKAIEERLSALNQIAEVDGTENGPSDAEIAQALGAGLDDEEPDVRKRAAHLWGRQRTRRQRSSP